MVNKVSVPIDAKGAFVRPASNFRNWVSRSSDAQFPPEKDRYHLYISLACPWASRCLAVMYMKGLDKFIGLSIAHPVFQRTRPNDPEDTHVGWVFVDPKVTPSLPGPSGLGSYSSKGSIPDTVNNTTFVRDLYEMVSSEKTRYTVPILWDKKQNTIVSNESADIVRMFNTEFNDLVSSTATALDLYPEELRSKIDEINGWVYKDINNGVYKCGFAASQEAYNEAVTNVFEGLDRAEAILATQRYLAGDVFTEADLRLFVTLIRFDEVYYVHFKANKKLIQEYPNLSNYLRDIYQHAPIKRSVNMDHIKLSYYSSLTRGDVIAIVPAGPTYDYDAPHDRTRFASVKVPIFDQSRTGKNQSDAVVAVDWIEELAEMVAKRSNTKSSTAAAASPKQSAKAPAAAVAEEEAPEEQQEQSETEDESDVPPADDESGEEEGEGADSGDETHSDVGGDADEDDGLDLDVGAPEGDDNDEEEEEEEEELDAVGFGDAMSKILGQNVAEDAQPILAKRTTQRMREIMEEKKVTKTARISAAEKREKEQKDMIIPDHSTVVQDRRLRTIATKGVVALFNAIEKHQHQNGKKSDEKNDKKVKEMSKDNFLGLLKASQKSVTESAAAAPAAKSSWSVVQDDFMMGAKLKDWDATHGTEKGRARNNDDEETEAAEDAAWKQVGDLDSDDEGTKAASSLSSSSAKRKNAKSSDRKPAGKKAKRS